MFCLTLASLLLGLVGCVVLLNAHRSRRSAPLPPGPRPLPIIGNLHQLPLVDSFKAFNEWAKTYGPLIYFHTFGREFIVINDLKIALELFEKRSALYSTKPRLVMAGELVGKEKTSMIFSKYGARLKECRQIVHSWMSKQAIHESWPTQEVESYRLMESLLDDPARFSEHIRTHAGTVLLRLLYGIRCLRDNDPHIALSERVCGLTAEAMRPGRWLCDSFPSLAYVPAWFPGASFQRWAARTRRVTDHLIRDPYLAVQAAVLDGTAAKSWVADEILDEFDQPRSGEDADNLMVAAGSLYAAGIDTTVSAVRTFFLMMVRHPEIQRKAQAECDSVVGRERLPNIMDRPSMPYLNCVMKEVLRFCSIVPLMPHSLDSDDIYEGFLIPKDAWVMVNSWAILHDPRNYPEPEVFKPERFDPDLGDVGELDPETLCFGLGRRSCAGMHFAQSWLFLNLAHVLFAFDIRPATGEGPPKAEFNSGHIRVPSQFRCEVVPRSEEKAALLRQVASTTREG